ATQARRSLSEMQMAADGKHAIFAEGSIEKVLSGIGMSKEHNMQLDEGSVRQLQAQWLARLINKTVTADSNGLKDGMKAFRDLHGVNADAMLEQSRLASETCAGQGSAWMGGLLRTKVGSDGRKTTDLTDVDDKADGEGLKYIASKRTNAVSGSKLTSLAGGVSGLVDRSADGKAVVKSSASVEMLSKVLSPLTGNMLSNVDEFVKQDLATIFTNSGDQALSSLKSSLANKDTGASDKKAITKLFGDVLKRMKDATTEEQGAKARLEGIIKELNKAAK
ncbi:MAG: hypothetical protein AAB874_06470, partial [Patescibacteria group bacterium]